MPMDIRKFFKKKEPSKSTLRKPTSSSSGAAPPPSASSSHKPKAQRPRQQVVDGPENETNKLLTHQDGDKEVSPPSPQKKTVKGTKKQSPVSSGPKSPAGKRKRQQQVLVDSDDEDYVEIMQDLPSSPKKKASSPLHKKVPKKGNDTKVPMSAADFFAQAGRKKTSTITSGTQQKTAARPATTSSSSPAKKGRASSPLPPSPSRKTHTPVSSMQGSGTPSTKKVKASSPPTATPSSPAKRSKPSSPTRTAKTTAASSSPAAVTKKSKASTPKKEPKKPLAPTNVEPVAHFSATQAAVECLLGLTFCITAYDPHWSREDATDFLKTLGARVTGAVSSKTDYLVVLGDKLEDGRPYTEGSKYKKATTECGTRVLVGRSLLNGVVKFHSDQQGGPCPPPPVAAATVVSKKDPPKAPAAQMKNPYARKITNPYARKPAASSAPSSNPATLPAAKSVPTKSSMVGTGSDGPRLWVDKYKPSRSQDILGNQDSVRKLRVWLDRWESEFNKDSLIGKSFSNPKGPWKAVLLSGPPGIGKTTTATLVAQESGRHVLEFNASDVRSKKSLKEDIGDVTGSRTLTFGKQSHNATKRVIIMDEVDGLGAGDRGGIAELIQMIKGSRVPIICICNDRQSQKIKSLVPHCMDLRYRRPVKSQIATRIVQIARQEGLTVEINAAETLSESCGNDIRQCLNACQMWATESDGKRMSYANFKEREKSINKDEMLRVSMFDATKVIVEGRSGLQGATPEVERSHFLKRNDAFFVDYNFMGLMVQQNYLTVLKSPFSRALLAKQTDEVDSMLERMALASEAMSDFALAEHKLRSDQNWSVLPFVGSLAVKTGFHAGGDHGGFFGGFPEFTTWLGKNSSKGKKTRIIQDLQHHMNFRISGGSEEMRLSYLPVLRGRFLTLLKDKSGSRTDEAIALMDEYGLSRDDILENLDEFKMDPKDKGFSVLDSKQKASITRAYNAVSHKSQALVVEQGGAKKTKRSASAVVDELGDPDVVDDDKNLSQEDEEEEMDEKTAAAFFKKKGRKKAAPKRGTKKAEPKRKKK